MLVLRDGRKLIGVLRSWDQFGENVVNVTEQWAYAVMYSKLGITRYH